MRRMLGTFVEDSQSPEEKLREAAVACGFRMEARG